MARYNTHDYEKRYLIVNKNGVISRIITKDDLGKHIKQCLTTGDLIYSIKVIEKDDVYLTISDAGLEMDCLPVHSSWATGAWPDKQYAVPSVICEIEKMTRLDGLLNKFIFGNLKCPKCGKSCSSMSGYTLHTKNCKAEPESKNGIIYSCNICGKKTISKFGLTNHIKAYHLKIHGQGNKE